jgi:hypothetical protein
MNAQAETDDTLIFGAKQNMNYAAKTSITNSIAFATAAFGAHDQKTSDDVAAANGEIVNSSGSTSEPDAITDNGHKKKSAADQSATKDDDQSSEKTATVVGTTSDGLAKGLKRLTNLIKSLSSKYSPGSEESTELDELSEMIGGLGKVFEGSNDAIILYNLVSIASDIQSDPSKKSNWAKLGIQVSALGASAVPFVGFGLSIGIEYFNYSTQGKQFYNWIDKK